MLISREVWHKIGKFDEAFTPMYFEDIDYCIRAAKEGIPLIEFDRDEWGIEHLYMDKEQARADFKEKKTELLNSLKTSCISPSKPTSPKARTADRALSRSPLHPIPCPSVWS